MHVGGQREETGVCHLPSGVFTHIFWCIHSSCTRGVLRVNSFSLTENFFVTSRVLSGSRREV